MVLLIVPLLAAGVFAGSTIVPKFFGKDYPKQWDPRVAELVSFVERERALKFKHPVHVDFLVEDEFRKKVTRSEKVDEEQARQAESMEAMLRAVGLLTGDVDLDDIGDELVGDGVVGLYSFEDERILIRGDTLDDERRSTVVHELTHALQDQHFDIGAREPKNSGEAAAYVATVEADAEEVEAAWRETLPAEARAELEQAEQATGEAADFDGVPEVFIELMSFPYAFGPDFLRTVLDEKGQAGRNALFTHPPTSEEHILLPETYLSRQAVTHVPTPPLAEGETEIEDSAGDFGMLSLLVVLAERLDFAVAWPAVQGWAGDSVVAFEREHRTCVRIDVAFDEVEHAERFDAAFAEWSRDAQATHSRQDRQVRVESCDPGKDSSGGRSEGHVSGIQGLALRRTMMTGLQQFGATPEAATCIADGLLGRLGANRLAELDRLGQQNQRKAVAELQSTTALVARGCQ